MVLLLVVVLAVVDPTGQRAPVGGQRMPVVRFGGVYQWAPLVIRLPVPALFLVGPHPGFVVALTFAVGVAPGLRLPGHR